LDLSVRIYPNPAKDNLVVEYQMTDKKEVDISLHSVLGQKVATFEQKDNLRQQKASLSLGTKNLTPGLYFVVFNVEGKQRSYKVKADNKILCECLNSQRILSLYYYYSLLCCWRKDYCLPENK